MNNTRMFIDKTSGSSLNAYGGGAQHFWWLTLETYGVTYPKTSSTQPALMVEAVPIHMLEPDMTTWAHARGGIHVDMPTWINL